MEPLMQRPLRDEGQPPAELAEAPMQRLRREVLHLRRRRGARA